MKEYQIIIFTLLLPAIFSDCISFSSSGLEECEKKELSQTEKSEGGVVCCFAESEPIKGCDYVDKKTYRKIIKGKNIISDNIGYAYKYECPKKSGSANWHFVIFLLLLFIILCIKIKK